MKISKINPCDLINLLHAISKLRNFKKRQRGRRAGGVSQNRGFFGAFALADASGYNVRRLPLHHMRTPLRDILQS